MVTVSIAFDPELRAVLLHPKLQAALENDLKAKAVFDTLTPLLQKEILRYIHPLKSEDSVDRNVAKAIRFLLGEGRFIGRKSL